MGGEKQMCASFAHGIDEAMIGDFEYNRESLDLTKFCKTFWENTVQNAAIDKKKEIEEQEKLAAEKKAAEEKAAAEKKAAEKKAAAEKALEEKRKADAERKAVETKKKAEEA